MIDDDTDWKQWCYQNCPDTQFVASNTVNDITTKSPTQMITTTITESPSKFPTSNPSKISTTATTTTDIPTKSPITTEPNPTDIGAAKAESGSFSSFTDEQINSFLNTLVAFEITFCIAVIIFCIVASAYVYRICKKPKRIRNINVHGIEMQQASPLPTTGGDTPPAHLE
eukprot:405498_1